MSSSVSTILKQRRKELGLSVKSVCEELRKHGVDVSEKTLYGWEAGNRQPDADTFVILCGVYHIGSFSEIKTAPLYSSEALKLANDYDNKMGEWGRETVRKVADIEIARYNDEGQAKAKVVKLPLETDVLKIAGRDGSFREILLTDELRKELHEYLDRLQLQDASDIL